MGGPLFPQWIDRLRPLAGILLVAIPLYAVGIAYYGGSAETTDVGYSPKQPVPFSHRLHAGELGMDCRYCHTTVEKAAHAAIPSTEICMNCHANIAPTSPLLQPVCESYASGNPIPWIRVDDIPDYAYFDHSAHVNRGVGCVSCHGRVDTMDQVVQVKTLRMGWCLECHHNPDPNLRPQDRITDLTWVPQEDQATLGRTLREKNNLHPSTRLFHMSSLDDPATVPPGVAAGGGRPIGGAWPSWPTPQGFVRSWKRSFQPRPTPAG